MAAENDESWVVILPEVFNLLLTKPDKVVDDTSIEKLLAWISDVCGTSSGREKILTHVLSFLSSAEIFHSCTTLSFALRVCGIIWCKDSGSFKENPSWIELFAKARDVLWQEAVVRDAYFTGLTSLAMFDEGLQWMQENRGCLSTAVHCMSNDTSMFVASAARLFIARFLISSCNHNFVNTSQSLQQIDWLLVSLQQKLTSNSQDSSVNNKEKIAVLDVIRLLMTETVTIGQEIVSSSKLLVNCIDMAGTDDENVCRKLVEVIGEILEKYSNHEDLSWNKLFSFNGETDDQSAACRLLSFSLDLYKRGMMGDSLYLISSMALIDNKTNRVVPSTWINIVSCLITAPLSTLEDITCPNVPNGSNTNGIDGLDVSALANDMMSLKETDTSDLKVVQDKLNNLLKPWLTSKSIQIAVLNQTLSAITEIATKIANIPCTTITEWIEVSLKILKGSLYTSEKPGFHVNVQENDKVVKTLITVLVALLKHLFSLPNLRKSKTNLLDKKIILSE